MMHQELPITLALETERLLIRSPQEGDAATLRAAIAKSMDELRVWMPSAQSVPTLEDATENGILPFGWHPEPREGSLRNGTLAPSL